MLFPYHEGPLLYGLHNIRSKLVDLSHINLDELCMIFNDNQYKDYFNFCIIRDPLQRFKAGYIEYLHHIKHNFKEKPKSVSEVLQVIQNTNLLINDARYVHFRPQTFYTHDANGKQLLHIFHIEDIDTCMEFVYNRMGITSLCYDNIKINAGKYIEFDKNIGLTYDDMLKFKQVYKKDYDLLFLNRDNFNTIVV